ncbi:MAG: hypothetical protein ACRECD_14405 [Burkholderiaceae bacterium]
MMKISLFADTSVDCRRRFYVGLSVVLLAACLIVAFRAPIAFPLDDAYITIHNAIVLLSGADPNYEGVPALIGATSSVHLLLVAVMAQITSPLLGSFIVTGFGILAYGLGLARLTFQLGGSALLAAIIAALGLLMGYTSYQLFNGLETGLAMAAITWVLVLAAMPTTSRLLALLCGVLPFIRPELIVLSGVLMLRQGWGQVKAGRIAEVVLDCFICFLGAAPWLVWQWVDTGSIVPLTASAKRVFFAEEGLPWQRRLGMIAAALAQSGLFPLALAIPFLRRVPLGWGILTFAVSTIFVLFVVFPGGAAHNHSRYLFILSPPLLCGLIGLVRTERLGVPLLVVAFGSMLLSGPLAWADYNADVRQTKTELAGVAQWARETLPADARILVHDAGYFAYATSFRLIDVVGLKTPASIEFHRAHGPAGSVADRSPAINLIANHFCPHYAIVLHEPHRFWRQIEADLQAGGWGLRQLRAPAGEVGYFVYELTAPGSR